MDGIMWPKSHDKLECTTNLEVLLIPVQLTTPVYFYWKCKKKNCSRFYTRTLTCKLYCRQTKASKYYHMIISRAVYLKSMLLKSKATYSGVDTHHIYSSNDCTFWATIQGDHYITGTAPGGGKGWGLWLLRNNHRGLRLYMYNQGLNINNNFLD